MSNLIKRDTLQYMKSKHTPNYTSDDYIILDTLDKIQTAEIQMAAIPSEYRKIEGNNIVEMSASEKVAVDDEKLDKKKKDKKQKIDYKTGLLIIDGFDYDSKKFSLSIEAQANWTSLLGMKSILPYPITVTDYDDYEYVINNETELLSICGAGMGKKKGFIDDGRDLKIAVNEATTESEIDTVIDNR